jgi:hypothetical protein
MMIEVTPYDSYHITNEKRSVMVARIVSVEGYPRGNTAWITLDTGKAFQVLESRDTVVRLIRAATPPPDAGTAAKEREP